MKTIITTALVALSLAGVATTASANVQSDWAQEVFTPKN